MKASWLVVFFLLLAAPAAIGQTKKTFTVKAETSIQESLGMNLFLYPQFMNGVTYFKNGTTAGGKFNYNLLSDEIVFISGKDSMALANEEDVAVVVIGKDSFYYDKGYVQPLVNKPGVMIAKKERIRILGTEKLGAYGGESSATTVESYSEMNAAAGNQKLVVKQNTVLGWETVYFVGHKGHYNILNKKSLSDALPKGRNDVKEYIDKNNVNFTKEADILNLITFLQQK